MNVLISIIFYSFAENRVYNRERHLCIFIKKVPAYEEIGFVSLASIVMGIIGLIPSIAEIIDGDKRTIVVITLIISIISLVIIIVTLISIYPIMMK